MTEFQLKVEKEKDPTSKKLVSISCERKDYRKSLVEKDKLCYTRSVVAKDVSGLAKKQGILRKQSRRGRWQKRFFAINNSHLNYYHIGKSGRTHAGVAGTIDLRDVTYICVLSRNGIPSKKIAIQTEGPNLHQNECYFLQASSATQAASWVAALINRRNYFATDKTEEEDNNGLTSPSNSKYKNEAAWWDESEESSDEGYMTGEDEVDTEDESLDSEPICSKSSELLSHPALPPNNWVQPPATHMKVRSASYLHDKVKIPAAEPLFQLLAVDNFSTSERVDHICGYKSNRIQKSLAIGETVPFMFVLHLQLPGPPFYSFVLYFGATPTAQDLLFPEDPKKDAVVDVPSKWGQLARDFFLGQDDEFRNERFKFIPRIVEGPYVVRRFVPSKPALMGRKLKIRYFQTNNYLEVALDIGSSIVAWKSTQLALGYAKLLTVDLGLVLEGQDVEELPEQVIGIARIMHVDFQSMSEPFDSSC